MTILVLLPLLAAGMLLLFAAARSSLRRLPAHEYQQLVRAPAWMTVFVGAAIASLSLIALVGCTSQSAQLFIGGRHKALLIVDAYSLWGSMLLGTVLAVCASVPAARRCLLPRAIPCYVTTLLLTWFAELLLFSQWVSLSLFSWLCLLAGAMVFCALLTRPGWRWEQLEIFLVLALAGVLGAIGLIWLRTLAQGGEMTSMWTTLLASSPRETNTALLLLALGWLGPAIYLPWWAWEHREEQTSVLLPTVMVLATAGVLAFIRVIFFTVPPGGGDLSQIPGVEHLFLMKRMLNWLLSWGVLSLLLGTVWLAFVAVRRRYRHAGAFRPFVFVVSGLLLLGISGGLLGLTGGAIGHRTHAMTGMLWTLLTWVGVTTVWLSAGQLFPALTVEQDYRERLLLRLALWLALFALIVPPLPGYYAIAACWDTWRRFGVPPALVLIALLVAIGSIMSLLPLWMRRQVASVQHSGAGWGILGPSVVAFLLLFTGVFARVFTAVFAMIRESLLHPF